jgi:hypothetical protein
VNADTSCGNTGILSAVVSCNCTLLDLMLGSQGGGHGSAGKDREREERELHCVFKLGDSIND